MSATPRPAAVAPLVLTMGEPAGIGPEITLATWIHRAEAGLPVFAAVADPDLLSRTAAALGLRAQIQIIADFQEAAACFADALPVLPEPLATPVAAGHPDIANAPAVIRSIARAVAFVHDGAAAAVVTNPIQKSVLAASGFAHPGHTEYLAALAAEHWGGPAPRPVMMLAAPCLRTVPVTIHAPLSAVPGLLRTEDIVEAGRIVAKALHERFGIEHPRLVLAGLNPHAGEGGLLGTEDAAIIAPAAATLQADGIAAEGPVSADTLFHEAARTRYDAALCMYHDQALIPVKTLAFDQAVNVTLGLPFIRTSPDHGTALDIAGRGLARPDNLMAALRLAGALVRQRRTS